MAGDGTIKVLLVDDDEDDHLLTRDVLDEIEPGRYDLEWAPSYAAGLAALARCEHDVCLVDYRLGQHSGLDLLREASRVRCAAPMILLTGLGEHAVDVAAIRAGAVDYLVKAQLSPVLLERSIRHALERRRSEQERLTRLELEAALRARNEVLAATSHDLKTPLSVIKGVTQLLQRHVERADELDRARLAEGLARIDAASERMVRQLDDLLDAASLQAGRSLELRREPTDLVALARRAVAAHQQTTDAHDLVLDFSAPELVGVWDAPRLERVLDNLLSNAIKYSPNGGTITVTLRSEADAQGTWAVLAVRDEGIGIPAADLPHVFDRFRRGTNVAGVIVGTGIGLAGARQLVEQHGGTLDAASVEGSGSTFTLRLPLAPPDDA